jgi:16S rRNA (adenine1518-N6/adenine1519-N6)-dimethyltransferase
MSKFQTKKSLGQHFLNSPHALTAMVAAGNIVNSDTVIEIGPGEGVLTKELLTTGAHVIAIEADSRLIPILSETFAEEIKKKQLTLIHTDVRNYNYATQAPKNYKVVANIPYYITGEIIRDLLSSKNKPSSITILIQKEVAERITTRKESKESVLSISIKAYGEPKYIKISHYA